MGKSKDVFSLVKLSATNKQIDETLEEIVCECCIIVSQKLYSLLHAESFKITHSIIRT